MSAINLAGGTGAANLFHDFQSRPDISIRPPGPFDSRCPPDILRPDDTTEFTWGGCWGGDVQITLDTGRMGPDDVKIVINEDGSSTVTVNGQEFKYSAEETKNLHVRVDPDDNVQVEDHRSPFAKAADPNPIDVFTYP